MIDFRIHTFLAVCKYMNFTRAAEELHITQPAVSQHMRYLEQLYRVPLFLHEGKKVHLTPAGELLFSAATTLKNDEAFIIEQMQHASVHEFPLIFGVTMTIGEYVIASPLAAYLKKHPDIDVKIILGNTSELLSLLESGEIHFALVEGYYDTSRYDSLTYRTEAFVPVCANNHPFAKEPHSITDLLGERLLLREPGSGTRDILEKNLTVKNIQLENFAHTMEVSSMHTIIQLLKEDCGISFLYQTAIEKELSEHSLRRLQLLDFDMSHDFTFLWNKGSIFSESYRNICMELKKANHF